MKKVRRGGGWPALVYTLKKGKEVGGLWKLFRAMRSKNACKTCALGMGGQKGGMVNESGSFPEVCKKSLQAMAADMQGAVKPEFWTRFGPTELRAMTPRQLESSGRLTQPVLYTAERNRYQPIAWEEAMERIAAKFSSLSANETFWYFSGRSSNEAGFLLQLFARLFGTNNVNNCSYYCHQASGVGLTSSTGSGTATIVLEDLEHCDLVFVMGGNPASNHPRLMRTLMQLRRRGGEVVVINPIVETGMVDFAVPSDVRSLLFGSKIASLYVQPHIGGDLALLTGVAKRIVELGAQDEPYLTSNCVGWPALRESLAAFSWDEIVGKSGVERAEIDAVAQRYASAKRAVFSWTMGITHHAHGVHNVQAIANLALLRGMVGAPGTGLMPIRGHSNVQGIGSVGVTPKLREAVFERLQQHFGVALPTTAGLDTMACIERAERGELKAGFCLGGNLYGSNPDAAFAARALQKLDMLVYLNTTLNTGHAHGLARETLILPVLARDEEPQPTTQESMFNLVRLSDGGPRRHAGPLSEVEVIASIAQRVCERMAVRTTASASPARVEPHAAEPYAAERLSKVDWKSMQDTGRIRQAIAAILPEFEEMAALDATKQEFYVRGRTLHEARFPTSNGKARLHTHQLPELYGRGPRELRLMTIRSEGQFNTVVYEEYDLYRGVERRDVVLLHPDDMARFGVQPGQRVTVCGPAGRMPRIGVHPFAEIRPGNAAMYYPEANVLVGRGLDPASKTPAFKCVVVTLEQEAG